MSNVIYDSGDRYESLYYLGESSSIDELPNYGGQFGKGDIQNLGLTLDITQIQSMVDVANRQIPGVDIGMVRPITVQNIVDGVMVNVGDYLKAHGYRQIAEPTFDGIHIWVKGIKTGEGESDATQITWVDVVFGAIGAVLLWFGVTAPIGYLILGWVLYRAALIVIPIVGPIIDDVGYTIGEIVDQGDRLLQPLGQFQDIGKLAIIGLVGFMAFKFLFSPR